MAQNPHTGGHGREFTDGRYSHRNLPFNHANKWLSRVHVDHRAVAQTGMEFAGVMVGALTGGDDKRWQHGRADRDELVHDAGRPSMPAVDSHHPSPASQQVSSGSTGARRSDFRPTPRSRANAAVSRRLISGSRAPLNSMNPAGRRNDAA